MALHLALLFGLLLEQVPAKELNAGSDGCPQVPTPSIDSQKTGTFTTNTRLLIIAGAFSAASLLISAISYCSHALHYSNPQEQVKIMRIIAYIPILAVISWGCIWLDLNAWYLSPWLSFFEAFALASFFMLVCDFISPNAEEHPKVFDGIKNRRGKLLGQIWFYRAKRAVYQYTPISLLIAVLTDATFATDHYCITSSGVKHAKFWLNLIRLISVNLAVMFLIAFTLRLREKLSNHKIFLKLLALKSIVFVEGIQTFVFSIVIDHVTPNETFTWADIAVGIPNLLLCIESFLAAILVFYAYPCDSYKGGSRGNMFHALSAPLNPLEVYREFRVGLRPPTRSNLSRREEELDLIREPVITRTAPPGGKGYQNVAQTEVHGVE